MTRTKTFGNGIALPASKLTASMPLGRNAPVPIETSRFARNGKIPDVAMINTLNAAANHAALFRTKEVFRGTGPTSPVTSSSATAAQRNRWRFAFNTGPYTHSLRVIAVMVPQSTNSSSDAYSRLEVFNSSGSVVSTQDFHYGNNPTSAGTDVGWDYIKTIVKYASVSPDTQYSGLFSDFNYGRIMAACVYEMPSMTQNFSGYLPQNLAAQSNILDVYRQYQQTIQYNLWRRGAATVLNWTVDTTAISTTTTTPKNIIDNSSTAVSSSTPGFTLDMTGKNRVSQPSGVPCKVWAYGSSVIGIGWVYLKDSSGAIIASITGFPAGGGWRSTTVTLPATVAKYDIHYAIDLSDPDTMTLYAVSIYEYE